MLILLLLCQIVFGCVSSIPIGGAIEDGRFGFTFGQNFVKSGDNEMLQKSIQQSREDERLGTRSSRDVKESNTASNVKVQDDAGKSVMDTSRCGRPDMKLSDVDSGRAALDGQYELSNAPLSYSLSGRRWWKITVTWKIVNLSRKLTEAEQTLALESALAQWAEHIPLKFRHAPNQEADINILFSRGEHGDPWAFDGQGQVLAHAFPPGRGIGGDVHFDDDEAWTIGTGQGTDLLTVALHEFGHALGLEHSDDHSSIMTPQYIYREGPKLSDADVAGIKAVYYRPAS